MILNFPDYQYMPAWKLCNILSLILLSYLLPCILEAVEEKMLDTSAIDSYRCFLLRPSKVKILKFILFIWKLIKMLTVGVLILYRLSYVDWLSPISYIHSDFFLIYQTSKMECSCSKQSRGINFFKSQK